MIVSASIALVPTVAAAGGTSGAWIWGVAAGSPQTLALTLERRAQSPVRIHAHAGTILLASSLGLRALLLSPSKGVAPYAFMGGGVLHVSEGEGGGGQGATGYGWAGGGVRFRAGSVAWFGELGILWGMNEDNGYEPTLPGIAVGAVFGDQRAP